MNDLPHISIIGAGRVGTALARCLHNLGYAVDVLVATSLEHAALAAARVGAGLPHTDPGAALGADIVFLTVPDGLIGPVCAELASAPGWHERHTAVHCSGLLSSEVLATAAQAGAAVLSCHPLLSISDPLRGATALLGTYYALEGCGRGLAVGRKLVHNMGGVCLEVTEGRKPMYHAAAALASNSITALLDIALELATAAGIDHDTAQQALCALASGAVANVRTTGSLAALTGPIERGDAVTVTAHLSVLAAMPEMAAVYKALGLRCTAMAATKGSAPAAQLAAIAKLLQDSGHN